MNNIISKNTIVDFGPNRGGAYWTACMRNPALPRPEGQSPLFPENSHWLASTTDAVLTSTKHKHVREVAYFSHKLTIGATLVNIENLLIWMTNQRVSMRSSDDALLCCCGGHSDGNASGPSRRSWINVKRAEGAVSVIILTNTSAHNTRMHPRRNATGILMVPRFSEEARDVVKYFQWACRARKVRWCLCDSSYSANRFDE